MGARKLHVLSPMENNDAINHMREDFSIKSITFDNETENKRHAELSVMTPFCHPYSSWEKGGGENVNKMLRRFPKRTDFVEVSEKRIRKAARMINEKPRKILEFRTALEVARKESVLLRDNNSCERGGCPPD